MYIKKKKSWEISEALVTDESYFRNRRSFMNLLGKTALTCSLYPSFSFASYQTTNKLNKKYFLPLPYTIEKLATTYTNFYEFGSSKNIWRRASKLKTDNWSIAIDGLVKKKKKFELNKFELRKELIDLINAGMSLSQASKYLAKKNNERMFSKFCFGPKVAPRVRWG